jgi:hypothetical protein
MSEDTVTAGKLAAIYLKIRDKRELLAKEFEAEDAKLKESQEAIEEELLTKCKEEDANSINTPFGTIIRSVKQRFWPADWDAFNRFVLENEAVGLFEKRVHQTNMAQWLEEHKDNPPPGLNVDRRYACSVRRPKK